jgi:arginase family enzyme
MDLNDYFEPVALDKPDDSFRPNDAMFGRSIRINTPSTPIGEISDYQLAILGVCEDRNSGNEGSSAAPDRIRQKLYELYRINEKVRIIDLGNLRHSDSPADTYFGLRDVMTDLLNNQVTAIVLGGTQDITHGMYMAFAQQKDAVNMVTVDARINLDERMTGATQQNMAALKSDKLFSYCNLGHQQYLTDSRHLDYFEEHLYDAVRLGELHQDISRAEPYLRDAHLVSFNIAAVRQSDAPATLRPTPNGFSAEEACQLSRYAGLSDRVSCFSLVEVNPKFDAHSQTAHLAAQVIWYFIEGYTQRRMERPVQNNPDFRVYLVNHQDMEHALTFYRSQVTGRWWMEVPDMKTDKVVFVACSQEEYQQACAHEIPEMWWRAFRRVN